MLKEREIRERRLPTMRSTHLAGAAACLLAAIAIAAALGLSPKPYAGPTVPEPEDPFAAYVTAECEVRQIAVPAHIDPDQGQMLYTWRDTDGILHTLRFVDDPNGDFRTVEGSGTVPVDETFSYEFVPEAEGGGTALVLYLEPNGGTTLGTWQVVGTLADGTATGFFLAGEAMGRPIAETMRIASKAAGISISRPGASPSVPTMEEVESIHLDLLQE